MPFVRSIKINNVKRGFTLIELLVVISIISLLSSIVMTSLNGARAKARDTKRIGDLRAVSTALSLYRNEYGTFCVANAGAGGRGWLNYPYSSPYGVAQQLVNLGYLSSVPVDPTQTSVTSGYMIYCTVDDFSLYATLERASVMPNCSLNAITDYDTAYGKNYCTSL